MTAIFETAEFKRALQLEREIRAALRGRHDWLSEYRKWLDERSIPAETGGWPSEQAYDPINVGNFIAYQLMV